MATIEDRVAELGLELPAPFAPPAGVEFRFDLVRVDGDRAYVSGCGPVDGDATLVQGKVGDGVDLDEARRAARLTGLAILAGLRHALGSLDRVGGWVKALVLVNAAPGFNQLPAVANGFSELILELWGERGKHSRSAIGVAELPFDWPVEVEAIVELD